MNNRKVKKLTGIIHIFTSSIIGLVLHKQSLISPGTNVIPRGNKVQGSWKNWGGGGGGGGAKKACYGRCENGG